MGPKICGSFPSVVTVWAPKGCLAILLQWGGFSLFGGLFQQFVVLDTSEEIGSASTVLDVFISDGDTFADNASPYPLVDDDTKGMFRNVENTSSLAMIGLVGHTLLEGSVTLNIDDITDFVDLQVG